MGKSQFPNRKGDAELTKQQMPEECPGRADRANLLEKEGGCWYQWEVWVERQS